MENNNNSKKQQNFSRPYNTKSSQSADSKNRKSDLSKCAFPRVPRRRDQQQPPPTTRNEQQRNSKQLSAKQRPNVDKRPRARGGASVGGGGIGSGGAFFGDRETANGNSNDSVFASSTGLVDSNYVDEVGYDDDDDFVDFDDVHYKGRDSRPMHLSGGKRKNLNHLLNFRYVFRERADHLGGARGMASGANGGGGSIGNAKKHYNQHKYNKEQFLQANFQFVIKSNVKPHLITSPDSIIDWSLIEQINIQTTEEPQCPICLYPPVAAKLTRCGHAYCWPCILHYLALNDKSWRKCPICYEAVHVNDLKSTAILQQQALNNGNAVSFQLMRRKKGSFFCEKFISTQSAAVERYPLYSGNSDMKPFSKFLLAKRSDILGIIQRERAELLADDDTTCPEYVFVQQALNLLNERLEKLGDIQQFIKGDEVDADVEEHEHEHEAVVDDSACSKAKSTSICEAAAIEENVPNFAAFESLVNEQIDCVADVGDVAAANTTVDVYSNIQANLAAVDSVACTQQQQKYYYFYQSVDGQNIFLHPLNVKMLQACYGALEFAPLTIDARIVQKECHTMDEDLRRKFTCLGHLPLTCQFSIVEVDLQTPIINAETLKLFKDDIKQRQLDRERRDREEKKRERKIAAINDRQMGKLISKTANINLSSAQEFPVCGFGFDLTPPAAVLNSNNLANSSSPTIAIKNNQIKSTASTAATAAHVPGSPPGPSYSSMITSQGISQVNNVGLFPELSLGAKPNRDNKHGTAGKQANNSNSSSTNRANVVEMLEGDCGETPKKMGTTFGDVMVQAIAARRKSGGNGGDSTTTTVSSSSTNNNNTPNGGNKKQQQQQQKREKKKMVPLVFN